MFQFDRLLVLFLLVMGSVAFSEEHKPEAAPAEGAAAATAPEVSYEDKKQTERTKEWMDLTSKLSALKTKIDAKELVVKDLIAAKNKAKSKSEAEQIVNNLLVEHKDLKKMMEEYNADTQMLKYRYPDVGITEVRKYRRLQIKSVDDYESGGTLSSAIKSTVSKAKSHYGVKEDPVEDKKSEAPKYQDNNNLAKPVILRK